jgi:hypothetical protein
MWANLGLHALGGWLLGVLCDGQGAALAPFFSGLRPVGVLGDPARAAGCGPWHYSDKGKPAGEVGREGEEEACPFTGAGGSGVASVIRLNSGGSSTMERMGLSLEQAKEVAARLWEAGEPPGCAWCVRLDEENEEEG